MRSSSGYASTKRIVRYSLLLSLGLFAVMLLLSVLQTGSLRWFALVTAVVWTGALFAIFFVLAYSMTHPRRPGGRWSSSYETTIVVDAPRERLRGLVAAAVEEFVGHDPERTVAFESPDVTEVDVPMSLWSFGERIRVNVEEDRIRVTSRCIAPTQIVAWGKNRRNVERLRRRLERNGIAP